MYLFKSNKKLLEEEIEEIEKGLGYKIIFLGKLKDRLTWEYELMIPEMSISDKQIRFIKERGLILFLADEYRKEKSIYEKS